MASIAIFFYNDYWSTANASTTWNAKHEGYNVLNAINDVVFFNNYSSGLSLYYFVSNLLTIILMLVIKNYIIDTEKILQKIEENKINQENLEDLLQD